MRRKLLKEASIENPQWVFVHGLSGASSPFGHVSGFLTSEEDPIYLEAPGLDGSMMPYDRISALAAHYRFHLGHPQKKRIVIGWSYGGLVAHELARQLRASGAEPLIVLLDCWAISNRKLGAKAGDEFGLYRDLLQGDAQHCDERLEAIRGCHERDRDALLIESLLKGRDDGRADIVRGMINVYRANMRAQQRYSPLPCLTGKALLVRAGDGPFSEVVSSTLGWDSIYQRLDVLAVPGNHYSMLDPPNVERLVEGIRGWAAQRSS